MKIKPWREQLLLKPTRHLTRLAGDWKSCAVGEQHAKYPEVVVYISHDYSPRLLPQDTELRMLGANFYSEVCNQDFVAAGKILDAIEDRVLELKREQNINKSDI